MKSRKTVNKKTHSFFVFSNRWKIVFHSPHSYITTVDKNTKGLTDTHTRHMDIDLEHLSEELLRHELAHVYAKELSFAELALKGEQIEDFFCEIVGKHGPLIVKQAKQLYQFARKLKWKKDS